MYSLCIEASIAEKKSRHSIRCQVEVEYINVSNFLWYRRYIKARINPLLFKHFLKLYLSEIDVISVSWRKSFWSQNLSSGEREKKKKNKKKKDERTDKWIVIKSTN